MYKKLVSSIDKIYEQISLLIYATEIINFFFINKIKLILSLIS